MVFAYDETCSRRVQPSSGQRARMPAAHPGPEALVGSVNHHLERGENEQSASLKRRGGRTAGWYGVSVKHSWFERKSRDSRSSFAMETGRPGEPAPPEPCTCSQSVQGPLTRRLPPRAPRSTQSPGRAREIHPEGNAPPRREGQVRGPTPRPLRGCFLVTVPWEPNSPP